MRSTKALSQNLLPLSAALSDAVRISLMCDEQVFRSMSGLECAPVAAE
jgi:hypothetical protein